MMKKSGKVYLVGAGPGDFGLLTLRGAEVLRFADVVVYDGLVNPKIVHLAEKAQKIHVGKYRLNPAKHYVDQKKINQLLVRLAKSGRVVVRLKGGDPFVFGRGGEEAIALAHANIPFEIIPGVSAGHAVPAYAGIPVTDRNLASSVLFVTAHENPHKSESSLDWDMIAKHSGTLVIFMGVQNLENVSKRIIAGGKAPSTLVSVIQWGTMPEQKTVSGTLVNISQAVEKEKLHSPALVIVGAVNQLRSKLKWYEKKVLFGKTVLVTRANHQASDFSRQLEMQGANVVEFPVIDILPPKSFKRLDECLKKENQFDWIIFTSVNAAQSVLTRMRKLNLDGRIFSSAKIAVVGESTKRYLFENNIIADLVPPEFSSESLFKMMRGLGLINGRRFFLPRTDIAPDILKKSLEMEGGRVNEVVAYRTVLAQKGVKSPLKKKVDELLKSGKIDFIAFTSASTVRNFFEVFRQNKDFLKAKLVSIGPVTSDAIRKLGFRPYREAKDHTISGLVKVITHG